MLDDFLMRAALAGVGVALAAGPLGCFMVWRRMAYFGDATAHAAVLGVALALALDIGVMPAVLLTALAMAVLVSELSGRDLALDTLLGVAAHAGLAFGVLAIALTGQRNVDLELYLFGEILAVSKGDLALIWGGGALVLALVVWRWPGLLLTTLNADLARASGIEARRERLILTLALALLVAVALKVVGALLITALLIVPAAAARSFAASPEGMAAGAAVLGGLSSLGGLWASWEWNLPAGPAIVAVASLIFALLTALGRMRG